MFRQLSVESPSLIGQHFRPVMLNVEDLLNRVCPEQISPLDEHNTSHETIAFVVTVTTR